MTAARKKSARARKKSKAPAKPKPQKRSGIWHSLQTWATEMSMDPETLKKALIKSDFNHVKNQDIPFKAIRAALFGEEYVEKLRGMRIGNDNKERKSAFDQGRLVEVDQVKQVLNARFVAPAVAALDNCPETAIEWRDKVLLPILRQSLGLGS